jgi:hypothetical protein
LFNTTGAGSAGLVFVMRAMLMSPDFLYLNENGDPTSAGNVFELTSWEIATRISYMLWDTMPDSGLMAAAADDSLKNKSVRVTQITRLLDDPRALAKFQRFEGYWLRLDKIGNLPTNQKITEGVDTNGLREDMLSELGEFIDTVAWKKKGSFRDLMTSDESFARSAGLANIYGHTPAASGQSAKMPMARGLLMRAPFLLNASPYSSPILRGAFVTKQLLCAELGAPAANVAGNLANVSTDDFIKQHSTRQRIEAMTAPQACAGCHATINPPGFALEHFDPLGRFRADEIDYNPDGSVLAQHPIDTNVTINTNGLSNPVSNESDLVSLVNQPATGEACFVRQMYSFYRQQVESNSDDACLMANVLDKMTSGQQSLQEALSELIVSDYTKFSKVQ